MRTLLLFLAASLLPAETVLVITADASDYILAAGGTIAAMARQGASVYVIRVTNDDKDSWDLTPEETASRTRQESEAAAKALGIREVIPLGYRAWELGAVSFTELRDKFVFYIRHHKPQVLFIPNPHAEYVRVLDRYYAGRAAEDAWRSAGIANVQVAFPEAGLAPHVTPEIYYFAQPHDPRRREPESSATFVPQPKVVDISGTIPVKIRAAQELKTINWSMAQRLRQRLDSTGRRLPLLDSLNELSVGRLVETNVRGLARIAAAGSKYSAAEEFVYAGPDYRVPKAYR